MNIELGIAEIVALLFSFLALVICFRNIAKYGASNKKAKKIFEKILNQNRKSLEIEIDDAINISLERIDVVKRRIKVINQRNSDMDISWYNKLLHALLEDSYKQYDRACKLYWENKIDRERFKRIYKSEIIKLLQNDLQNQHFHNQKNQYPNILRLYKRWKRIKTSKESTKSLKLMTS